METLSTQNALAHLLLFLFVDSEGLLLELVEHTVVDVDLVLVSKNMSSLLA